MLQHYAFFNFAKRYIVSTSSDEELRSRRTGDAGIPQVPRRRENSLTPKADLVENNDWVRSQIKTEIFVDSFGQEEGLKVRAESDPQVIKALDLLPRRTRVGRKRQEDRGGTECGASVAEIGPVTIYSGITKGTPPSVPFILKQSGTSSIR